MAPNNIQKEKEKKEKKEINYSKDLILSLTSNKGKIFSSKKVYILLAYVTMLTITIVYLFKNINKIAPLEFIEVIGLWLAYGGYNSYQNYRDRKLPSTQINSDQDADTSDENK